MTPAVEQILERARRSAEAAEVLYGESASTPVNFKDNQLNYVNTKSNRGVGLRLIRDGRLGFSSTTDFDRLDEMVAHALASARFGQEAKFTFPATAEHRPVRTFDPAVRDLSAEEAIRMGREAIEQIITARPDGVKCACAVSATSGRSRILNSAGLDVTLESTHFSCHLEALRVRGDDLLWTDDAHGTCRLEPRLDIFAKKILNDLILSDRSASIPSGTYPVIFTPRAVVDLLISFEQGVNGKLVQKGASPLAERLGQQVVDARINLYDDPTIDWASSSAPIDGEGVPTRRTDLFENGVLQNFVFDLQTAGMMGMRSTGNGARTYASLPEPALANLILATGDQPYEAMIAGMRRGLVVDEVIGSGQSNTLAGEFSVNLGLGFLVEQGEFVGRVKNCMIAGNVFDLFRNQLAGVGAEAVFRGSSCLPALQFHDVSVASQGEGG